MADKIRIPVKLTPTPVDETTAISEESWIDYDPSTRRVEVWTQRVFQDGTQRKSSRTFNPPCDLGLFWDPQSLLLNGGMAWTLWGEEGGDWEIIRSALETCLQRKSI